MTHDEEGPGRGRGRSSRGAGAGRGRGRGRQGRQEQQQDRRRGNRARQQHSDSTAPTTRPVDETTETAAVTAKDQSSGMDSRRAKRQTNDAPPSSNQVSDNDEGGEGGVNNDTNQQKKKGTRRRNKKLNQNKGSQLDKEVNEETLVELHESATAAVAGTKDLSEQTTSTATANDSKNKTRNKKSLSKDKSSTRTTATTPKHGDYPPHWSREVCLERYAAQTLVRGRLRVVPSARRDASSTVSFVTCDRGHYEADICIPTLHERNRAMNGDVVFVEVMNEANAETSEPKQQLVDEPRRIEEELPKPEYVAAMTCWKEDPLQVSLWNPIADIPRKADAAVTSGDSITTAAERKRQQRQGRVVGIVPPKPVQSELVSSSGGQQGMTLLQRRPLVGTLMELKSGIVLLTPNNKSLPQFKCPVYATKLMDVLKQGQSEGKREEDDTTQRENESKQDVNECTTGDEQGEKNSLEQMYFSAEYEYDSWKESYKWPPCVKVKLLGPSCVAEHEIEALLAEFNISHTEDFSASVLRNVNDAVKSGLYYSANDKTTKDMGWRPTQSMCRGRRDFRMERIFTIDPTTAKDLDDALHIKMVDGDRVEVGVHIADVSFFVKPNLDVDREAAGRATTVYLVDRTIPMLPRPLCEIACSLNENVDRLTFSVVWTMKLDGTLCPKSKPWYGRSVIRSCARLDYATAQNIIENKVAIADNGDEQEDDELWPASRRPEKRGRHSLWQVASDVRLMHRVAMARRKLRFDNGALALHSVKLTFSLDEDGQTPLLAAPYPIRDSNKLVEEFMLLANYLVAQQLVTHIPDLAVLRQHKAPCPIGLDAVVTIAKEVMNFHIDTTNSQTLHESLIRFGEECSDSLLHECVTNLLMTPMVAAEYFVTGLVDKSEWAHYALNIPYYCHFTSPIRRYADVLVHRLLQATLESSTDNRFYVDAKALEALCLNCNERTMGSKHAQERCDRIFLALYTKQHPMESVKGVVISLGKSAFTVYLPSLGTSALLYLHEHVDMRMLTFASKEDPASGTRWIVLQQSKKGNTAVESRWGTLEIKVFSMIRVTVQCKESPPIDIKLTLQGPWIEE